MVIKTKIEIESVEYSDPITTVVNRNTGDFNATSNFSITFPNDSGQYDSTFSLNDDVKIYADKDATPTTKIFSGIIENVAYSGKANKETLVLTGRDYGTILQDILVSPRIFKDTEASEIVESLMIQNLNGNELTWNNIDATSTVVDRITFNNISVFDAIKQLADISGFYFYVDEDKDLHFVDENSISSGETFDNTNVTNAKFKTSDSDIFNNISVYGDRQLTGAREVFAAQAGSVYTLDDKPSNVGVIGSATINVQIQPGGILNVNSPEDESVQFLVDYQASQVVLTSGATAGDNTGWIGSPVIIDYQRSSPLVSIRRDDASVTAYNIKDKIVVDRNIKSIEEANVKANTILAEHKDPKIQGTLEINGVLSVTPGNTAVVNIPFHNINNQTYKILNAKYNFTTVNCLSDNVLVVTMNKKIADFTDTTKDILLRLKKSEGADIDTAITLLEVGVGSPTVETSYTAISRSIGSAFYFHVPGHNQLDSSTALLGDIRAGSEVKTG